MLKLIENFFTHKDFLGGLNLPGRLFSPLHLIFYAFLLSSQIYLQANQFHISNHSY